MSASNSTTKAGAAHPQGSRVARNRWLASTALGAAAFLAAAPTAAQEIFPTALPTNIQSQSGGVTTAAQGSSLEVTVSDRAVINWGSFNVGSQASLQFVQPNKSSIVLNRDTSGTLSRIDGTISANGQVWLLNPAGVLVSPSGSVSTAGFLAATHALNVSDTDFVMGANNFTFANPGTGTVENQGLIDIANGGGYALLAGAMVANGGGLEPATAMIRANVGRVVLAGVPTFTLGLDGAGSLLSFQIGIDGATGEEAGFEGVEGPLVTNAGRIESLGGRVLLTARAASEAIENVVNMSGVINATSARIGAGGALIFDASSTRGEAVIDGGRNGAVQIGSGQTIADPGNSNEQIPFGGLINTNGEFGANGGSIEILGRDIKIGIAEERARLSASAVRGDGGTVAGSGGTIHIGTARAGSEFDTSGRPKANTIVVGNGNGIESGVPTSKIEAASFGGAGQSGGHIVIATGFGSGGEQQIDLAGVIDASASAHTDNSGGFNGIGGQIDIGGNRVLLQGTAGLNAEAMRSGGRGGGINILASDIQLIESAKLRVGAMQDGGTIVIGAGIAIPSALIEYASVVTNNINLGAEATVSASGGSTGVGGNIRIRADTATPGARFQSGASLVASGGRGGQIEIGAYELVQEGGQLDVAVPTLGYGCVILTGCAGGRISLTGSDVTISGPTSLVAHGYTLAGMVEATAVNSLSVGGQMLVETQGPTPTPTASELSGIRLISGGALAMGARLVSSEGNIHLQAGEVGNAEITEQVTTTAGNISIQSTGPAQTLSVLQGKEIGSATGDIMLSVADGGRIQSDGRLRTTSGHIQLTGGNGSFVYAGLAGYGSTAFLEGRSLTLSTGLGAQTDARLFGVSLAGGNFVGNLGSSARLEVFNLMTGGGNVMITGASDNTVSLSDLTTVSGSGAGTVDVNVAGMGTINVTNYIDASGGSVLLAANLINVGIRIDASEARLTADNIELTGSIYAPTVAIAPRSINRNIRVGGGGPDPNDALALSTAEFGRIRARNRTIGLADGTGLLTFIASEGEMSPIECEGGCRPVTILQAGGVGGRVTMTGQGQDQANGVLRLIADESITLDSGLIFNLSGELELITGGIFTNFAGAGAFSGSGQWLIHSADPAGNFFNGLLSTHHALWGQTYPGVLANGRTQSGATGNRYSFSLSPTLTVTAKDRFKIYGDSLDLAAPASGSGYSVTGLIDAGAYGNVFLQDAFTGVPMLTSGGSSATADAGSYAIDIQPGSLVAPVGYTVVNRSGLLTVDPRLLTIRLGAVSKVYDGTTTALIGADGFVLDGLVNEDAVAGSGTATFADKNAGTGKRVNVSNLGLTGAKASNYRMSLSSSESSSSESSSSGSPWSSSASLNGTGTITQRALQGNATADSKVYDGTTAATGSVQLVGAIAGDVVGAQGGSFAFADKNAGTGKAVTGTGITLVGADAANYSFSGIASATADISRRQLSAVLTGNAQKVYDATTAATLGGAGVAFGGFVAGEGATATLSNGAYATPNVGTNLSVTAGLSLASNTGTDLANYILPINATGQIGTITPATLTYTANAATRATGAANPPLSGSVGGFVGGETQATATTGTLAFTTTANSASPSGSYAIDGGGLAATNYVFTQAPANATALTVFGGAGGAAPVQQVTNIIAQQASNQLRARPGTTPPPTILPTPPAVRPIANPNSALPALPTPPSPPAGPPANTPPPSGTTVNATPPSPVGNDAPPTPADAADQGDPVLAEANQPEELGEASQEKRELANTTVIVPGVSVLLPTPPRSADVPGADVPFSGSGNPSQW